MIKCEGPLVGNLLEGAKLNLSLLHLYSDSLQIDENPDKPVDGIENESASKGKKRNHISSSSESDGGGILEVFVTNLSLGFCLWE